MLQLNPLGLKMLGQVLGYVHTLQIHREKNLLCKTALVALDYELQICQWIFCGFYAEKKRS